VQGLEALKMDKEIDLETCDEVAVNTKLESILNRMLEETLVPGFSKAVFQTVIRGSELVNHDNTMPEKRPDLTFRPVRAIPGLLHPAQCVLIVECKIVEKARPMSRYCRDGLSRFVDGTYSWAVSTAVMLGYARDNYALPKQLHKHLDKYGENYNLVPPLTKRSRGVDDEDVYVSVHKRTSVTGISKGEKGQITVHHLWVTIA